MRMPTYISTNQSAAVPAPSSTQHKHRRHYLALNAHDIHTRTHALSLSVTHTQHGPYRGHRTVSGVHGTHHNSDWARLRLPGWCAGGHHQGSFCRAHLLRLHVRCLSPALSPRLPTPVVRIFCDSVCVLALASFGAIILETAHAGLLSSRSREMGVSRAGLCS